MFFLLQVCCVFFQMVSVFLLICRCVLFLFNWVPMFVFALSVCSFFASVSVCVVFFPLGRFVNPLVDWCVNGVRVRSSAGGLFQLGVDVLFVLRLDFDVLLLVN